MKRETADWKKETISGDEECQIQKKGKNEKVRDNSPNEKQSENDSYRMRRKERSCRHNFLFLSMLNWMRRRDCVWSDEGVKINETSKEM